MCNLYADAMPFQIKALRIPLDFGIWRVLEPITVGSEG
jgi:hypothetical protein